MNASYARARIIFVDGREFEDSVMLLDTRHPGPTVDLAMSKRDLGRVFSFIRTHRI